jgi:hypothetical protein
VYRDEAADLMAAAARGTSRPPRPELELQARRAAPIITPEAKPAPKRPLPYPEPVGINDNVDDIPPPTRPVRRRLGVLQLLARIVVAPLYLVVGAGAIGIIALFVRGLIGL